MSTLHFSHLISSVSHTVNRHAVRLFTVLSVCGILCTAPLTSMAETAPSDVGTTEVVVAEKVSINAADAQTLAATLKGVGIKKAEAIIAWRQANGEFMTVGQLTDVKGIGRSILEKNREKLTL